MDVMSVRMDTLNMVWSTVMRLWTVYSIMNWIMDVENVKKDMSQIAIMSVLYVA